MSYFHFSLNVRNNNVNIGVSVMNVTDFVTLYSQGEITVIQNEIIMCLNINILQCYVPNLSNMSNFHPCT